MKATATTGTTRRLVICALAVVSLAAARPPAAPAASSITRADDVEVAVAREVNAIRVRNGLPRLSLSPKLGAAADEKARGMARLGYFGHTAPGGVAFSAQIERHYPTDGFRRWRVGQNLLWSAVPLTAKTVVQRWLASPTHRVVLLRPLYREFAVAAVRATRATGPFRGQDVTIVTLDVGLRVR